MKKIFILFSITIIGFGCTNNTTDDKKEIADNRIALRTDTINTVKLTDTLVVFESTCRGCAYEASTNFSISDSMNVVKLIDVITIDEASPEMNGGSVNKDLLLVPVKTGLTIIKVYMFLKQEKTARDSANFTSYKIEVKQ